MLSWTEISYIFFRFWEIWSQTRAKFPILTHTVLLFRIHARLTTRNTCTQNGPTTNAIYMLTY